MNALLALIIRQALAACGGFFAANNITGETTSSIVIGVIMLLIPTVWSWIAKVIHLEDESRWGAISNNEIVRTLVGAIVSQGITALSVYFATDANNPELLGIAVINAAASKFGLQQKLAFLGAKDALKLCLLSLSVLSLASCSTLSAFALKNQAVIEEMVVYGVRSGVKAGFKKLDAKQPRDVTPEPTATSEACPPCLKLTPRVIVPRCGVEVAAALKTSASSSASY